MDRGDFFDSIGTPTARIVAGTISRVTSGSVFVIVPGYDSGQEFGPVVYNGFVPTVAARCIVAVITETGEAWIVSWEGAKDPDGLPGDLIASAAATRAGCLLCDGASYLRTTYANLFTAMGGAASPWGLPDGTHFNVPDLRGRTIIGAGTGSGLTARALGATIGEETHLLSLTEIPSHQHGLIYTAPGSSVGQNVVPSWNPSQIGSGATDVAGGGLAHNNMQPSRPANIFVHT